MSDQRDEGDTSPPAAKKFRFQQGHVDATQLYLGTKLVDVRFLFDSDDGTVIRVPAHKTLLAMASDVFEKMFYGTLKENGDVKIVDASPAAFKEFLQFFYLSEIKLTADHVVEVMCLGNKYNVEKCIEGCVKFLQKDLTNDNVCSTLSLAILYDRTDLMEACEKRILVNTKDVFGSAGFLECSRVALAHILRMNWLLCSEVDVFEACMAWVRAKCKQQVLSKALVKRYLGDSYYDIRFASITIQEFCTLERKYSAVLSSDFKTIVQLIAEPKEESKPFNARPRQTKRNLGAIIPCDRDIRTSDKWCALDTDEKTIFSTNELLLMDRFICHKIRFGESHPEFSRANLAVEVEITKSRSLDGANVKILSKMTANLGSQLKLVLMPQPILIRPGFFYTICIKGFPKGHCFTSNEQQSSITDLSGIEFEFHNDKIVDGCIVGLIWMLCFNKITHNNIID